MFILFGFLKLVSSFSGLFPCDTSQCPISILGDHICDLSCNIPLCCYDYLTDANSDCLLITGFDSNSDCYTLCLYHCDPSLLNNGVCDSQCNTRECAWDQGDCGYCAPGCTLDLLTNGICDPVCENALCMLDNYACGLCAPGCFAENLNSAVCIPECWVTSCEMVENNPCFTSSAPVCSRSLLVNGYCDEECNSPLYAYDMGACLCEEGCNLGLTYNEACLGLDDPCASSNCGFKSGKCGDCAVLCYEEMLGDGLCDEECNNYECQYDLMDCGCAPGCSSVYDEGWVWDTSGAEACMVPACEYNYGPGFPNAFLVREHILTQVIHRNWSLNTLVSHTGCDTSELEACDAGLACNVGSECYDQAGMYCMGVNANGAPNCLRYAEDRCMVCEGVMIMHVCTQEVEECPYGYQSQLEITQLFDETSITNLLCLRSPEVFNRQKYKEYYVKGADIPESTGSGTSTDPFNSLYFAFTKVYATFTKIILSSGDYYYQIDNSLVTPLVLNKYDPLNIDSFLEFYELWIIGDPISMSVIYWKEKLMISSLFYKTYIQNIIFKGDLILRNNCTEGWDFCYYCPILAVIDSIITTDSGSTISLDDYYQIPTNCSAYMTIPCSSSQILQFSRM